MKKKIFLVFSLFLVIGLISACSAKDPNTLQGVYDKALQASEKLKSFELNLDMNQEVTLPKMDKMSLDSKIKAQIQTDPQAFYQEIDTMGTKMKMYYTEEGLYIHDPSSDKWMKAPEDYLQQFNQLSKGQQNPTEQLSELKKYIDDFKLEEKDDSFELTFSGSGEKVNQFIQDQLAKNLPEGGNIEDLAKGLTVNSMKYVLIIEKDHYYPRAINLEMDIDVDQQGQKAKISQKVNGQYSKYNEVEEIKVPDDVKESAEELPMPS